MPKERREIAEDLTWDLSKIFESDESFERELAEVQAELAKAEDYKGKLAASASQLLGAVELELAVSQKVEKLYVYASMKNDQDTRVAQYQAYQSKASKLYADFSEAFAFFEPEFLGLSDEIYQTFLESEPKLQAYTHYFERLLAKKAHSLSQKEEELLASAGEIFSAAAETFEVLDNADIKFAEILDEKGEKVQLSHGNFISYMESADREVRKRAYQAMYANYEQFEHTYAKTLETTVKTHNFEAKARHYSSAREAALSSNFVPEQVYEVLIAAVHKYLPLLQRYVELRKAILGLDDLKMYDIYRPLSNLDYKFNYEAGKAKAEQVLSIFGEDYAELVKQAFSERWIDVEENAGKRSGAYSGGAYDTAPYILLNWQETLDDLFTLVHEMGHSMHSALTRASQPYVYGDYPIFLAEIASTTNENILTESLLAESKDDQQRFALLNHWLDSFRGTVFRQSQFAEFEQLIHLADADGTPLTSEFLNAEYAKLNEKYYGLSAEENPEIQYEWARIPHFYYNFYVFQYATGYAAATALAEKVVSGDEKDRKAYLDYLKAGSSDYPLNVIAKAGVDMAQPAYLDAAFQLFESRLNELEKLVAKGVHRG